jgi:hypothetical protein
MKRPTRQGLRQFMAGVGIVWLLLTSVATVILLHDHNSDLNKITTQSEQILSLQKTSHSLGVANHSLDSKLVGAGKEQITFAIWWVQSVSVIYQCVHTSTCVPLPPLPNLPGVTP